MKKSIIIELEGGLLAKEAGSPVLSLQPQVIYWLNKMLRYLNVELLLASDTGYPEELQQLLEKQGIVFKQIIPSSNSISAVSGEVWIIRSHENGFKAGNYDANSWEQIWQLLKGGPRVADHRRTTSETDIRVKLNLDGTGQTKIQTGLHFLDHMLQQIARHGGIDLEITAKGDLQIDEHHTIEDTALTLGEAMAIALGDKRGIERYGFCLPMDDALAQVAVDFGGRNWIVWDAAFTREKVGDVPTEMFFHFFKSFSDAARCNLNIKAEGSNEHHKIEAIFKAFARAIKMAVRRNLNDNQLPTTKGVL